MRLDFIKMHGAGNDYIYVICLEGEVKNPNEIAKKLSKRRFSIGADGLVLICSSKIADAKMRIFNADGSEAKMCGNALRCVGKLLYEEKIVKKSHIKIETPSGIRTVFVTVKDKKVGLVTADMGYATTGESFDFQVEDKKYEMLGVNVGNEHQVTFCENVDTLALDRIGWYFEKNPRFEGGVNTEFCTVLSKKYLKIRVFERGSGETLACGTGACAAVVAAQEMGLCERAVPIRVSMLGGEVIVFCDSERRIFLTGDANESFRGTVEV